MYVWAWALRHLGVRITLHVICRCFTPLNRGRKKKVVIFFFKFSAYKVEKEGTVKLGTWLRKCQKNEVILLAISKKIWVCGLFPVVFQWLKG